MRLPAQCKRCYHVVDLRELHECPGCNIGALCPGCFEEHLDERTHKRAAPTPAGPE